MANIPIIEAIALSKIFDLKKGRKAEQLVAVDAVDFTINEGEVVSIVGASGCGKSTILKMIGGLLPPSSGSIRLHGKEVTKSSSEVGMMFQQPTLLPWRGVEDNIVLPVEIREGRAAANAARVKARQLIDMVGLGQFSHAYPKELSGGMAQRAAICRMLVSDPDVLLLDEPFGALDEFTREQMNVEFERICLSRNATAVVVTHSLQEAVFLSDRVIVMSSRPGRILESVDINLPRPRVPEIMTTPEFNAYIRQLHDLLFGEKPKQLAQAVTA